MYQAYTTKPNIRFVIKRTQFNTNKIIFRIKKSAYL